MIKPIFYIVCWLLALDTLAQGNGAMPAPLSFTDSITTALNNYRTEEARNIAISFSEIWSGLGLDQQMQIRRQNTLLKEKRYTSRPIMLAYFGALVSAVKTEGITTQQLSAYLKVAERVIMNEPVEKVQEYFRASRIFFEHHALHYERFKILKILDDT